MPPKNIPQRRSRKETLQEDLVQLVDEENMNDEEVFPILKEALSEGVDVNLVIGDRSLICHFAVWGMIKCFEECFSLGADPTIVTSNHSSDALVSAVRGIASAATSLRMVGFLLNHMKFNQLNLNEAVDRACDSCRFEVARLLLRRNNSLANKVLCWGLCNAAKKLVEIALDFGATVNQVFPDGSYFVHIAAELQDSSILQMLLDGGADIEAENQSTNETPFEVAVRFNSVSCVKLLINRKCDFSTKNLLSLAVRCRSHDVLEELLKNEDLYDLLDADKLMLLFRSVFYDDLTAFKIIYPILAFCPTIIHRLVRLGKYDMLSAALFEFENRGLSPQDLTPLIAEAPNDNFKKLLQTKIDVMNGVDVVKKVKKEAEEDLLAKVKKEAEEEQQQQQQQQQQQRQNEEEEEAEGDHNEK